MSRGDPAAAGSLRAAEAIPRSAQGAVGIGGGRPRGHPPPLRAHRHARLSERPARGADTHGRPCPMTRDELYEHLRTNLSNPPRWLMAIERDVIAQAAALATASSGIEISFELRPGLVAEMLRFYDQLRRQSQQVSRFEALIEGALDGADAEVDRGAGRMRQQTRFLAATFREYERRVRESGGCDEHLLREQLIRQPLADPIRRIIVTVADWIADDNGLYVADFDLLSRIPNLESIDIVCTEG